MSLAIAGLASILFAVAMRHLGVVGLAAESVRISRQTAAVLIDNQAPEGIKEAASKRAALAMMRCAGALSLRVLIALAGAAVLPLIALWAGWVSERSLMDAFISWPILLLALAALVFELVILR